MLSPAVMDTQQGAVEHESAEGSNARPRNLGSPFGDEAAVYCKMRQCLQQTARPYKRIMNAFIITSLHAISCWHLHGLSEP